jgi:hypothetical protein
MQTRMTPIDVRHFGPDPEGKRKFVLHDGPPADICTKREFDLFPSHAATSVAWQIPAHESSR